MPPEKSKKSLSPAHLVGLWGFSVAQPIYDLLARHPTFLTAHGFNPWELVLLCIALSILLPLVLWAAVRAIGIIEPRAAMVGFIVVGIALVVVFTLQLPWWVDPSMSMWSGTILVMALAFMLGWFFFKTLAGQMLLHVLSILALVFPALFLLQSTAAVNFGGFNGTGVTVAVDQPFDVVILVFDELPTTALVNGGSTIDERYFPNFARLAKRATWYRNATTNASLTEFAIPALLTGNLPNPKSKPKTHFSSIPNNLFNLLSDAYQLHVHESITNLCHPRHCDKSGVNWQAVTFDLGLIVAHRVAPPDVRDTLPSIENRWGNFISPSAARLASDANRAGRFKVLSSFISDIGQNVDSGTDQGPGNKSNKPTLHFFHSLLPHSPYHYLPSGHRIYLQRQLQGLVKIDGHRRWSEAPDIVGEARALYLWQLRAVDTLIGQLIDRLDQLNRFDDTMIIVTADHGVSFRPGDLRRRVSTSNQWDIATVPLLVKFPRQTHGEVDNTNVESIDVLPMIADTLGFELPWPADGTSPRRFQVAARPMTDQRPSKQLVDVRTPMTLPPTIPAAAFTAWWSPDRDFESVDRALPGSMQACDNVSADLVDAELLQNVVPEEFVPAHLVGYLTRPLPDGEILIELNGRVVAAGTKSLAFDEFYVLIDERHFVRGRNHLEVLAHNNNQWCRLYGTLESTGK